MRYDEYAPSTALRPFVDRLWTLEAPAGSCDAEPVLPDGHVEIIVHAGDPFCEIVDGHRHRQSPVLLAGQLTRAVRLAPDGMTLVAGARLHPNGAHALLGLPQRHITDRVVDLSAAHERLAKLLLDDATSRADRTSLVAALDRALVRITPAAPRRSIAGHAISHAMSRRGLVQVSDLARVAGVSDRHLQRHFQDEVGMSPKRWLRVLRFQQVLRQLRGQSDDLRWAEIASTCGFYDQSHFVHDFRSFTGQPPTDWAIDDSSLTAVFSAIRREF